MNSFERIKGELLTRNQSEINQITAKIDSLNQQILEQQEQMKAKNSEMDKIKAEIASEIIDEEMFKDLHALFDFMASYNIINSAIDRISQMKPYWNINLTNLSLKFSEEQVEKVKRQIFLNSLQSLNEDLFKIISKESSENEEVTEKKESSGSLGEKGNLKEIIQLYKKTIERFKYYYNHFLSLDNQGHHIINSAFCNKNIVQIAYYNRKKQLSPEEKEKLELLQPENFWNEILVYYKIMDKMKSIVDNFVMRYEKYVKLYQTHPEWFDIACLKSLIDEAPGKIKRKKNLQKKVKDIEKGLKSDRVKILELKRKKTSLENSKSELEQKQKIIEEARNITDLGYKSTTEIAKKLKIDIKEYIIVPVFNGISNLDALFKNEKQLKIEADGKTFFVDYSNDTMHGKVNYLEDDRSIELVILIPINELKKEDIDNVQLGEVGLNRSAINVPGVIAFKRPTREFDFENANISVETDSDIVSRVKQFLGDDFGYQEVLENYQFFENIPDMSPEEENLKREAIQRGLAEHGCSQKKILVNGKPYELSRNDEKTIDIMSINEPLDEKALRLISSRIRNFLRGDIKGSSAELDKIYGDLLSKYFKVRKAIKEYDDEENTTIVINGKRISIKPRLPSKSEDIAKRYTRKGEDIVYKLMKLAQLVNRFAHLADEGTLKTTLFQLKNDLIEKAIDNSKSKKDIKIRRNFDRTLNQYSIVVEIPGYNMIALHILNKNNFLSKKAMNLEKFKGEIIFSPTIQYPGVNIDLLQALKKEKFDQRREYIQSLDKKTFYKLIIRMGFKPEDINKSREIIINTMVSNENINKLLDEYDGEAPDQ